MSEADYEKIIQQFCKDWIDWVDAGTPHGSLMLSKHKGLCANFLYWSLERGYYLDERRAAWIALCNMFLDQFGSRNYPFNHPTHFAVEVKDGTMHLNANRVAWARAQAAKLIEENV